MLLSLCLSLCCEVRGWCMPVTTCGTQQKAPLLQIQELEATVSNSNGDQTLLQSRLYATAFA